MEWWQLVLGLVVITGYVLKHIVTIAQEQQRANAPRQRVRDVLRPAPVEKSDEEVSAARTELDRRLEEAKQRRREMEDVEPTALPLPKRTLPKRTLPMPAPPVVVKPVPRYQPRVPEPTVVEVVKVARPVPAVPVKRAMPPAPALSAPRVTTTPHVTPQVMEFLHDRQTLATAMVLREILDPPVSRRRRGRRSV